MSHVFNTKTLPRGVCRVHVGVDIMVAFIVESGLRRIIRTSPQTHERAFDS
jgi:hypothetical protein